MTTDEGERNKVLMVIRRQLYGAGEGQLKKTLENCFGEGTSDGLKVEEMLTRFEDEMEKSKATADLGVERLTELLESLTVVETSEPNSAGTAPQKTLSGAAGEPTRNAPAVSQKNVVFHSQNFKLSNSIGERGNCLSYLSFLRQVEAGRKRGYSEMDILDGVIRAIEPTCKLREYLEGIEELTLGEAQTVIRGYYREKSATQLYQELCSLNQGHKESPQDFLYRALALRQKIIFASREASSSFDTTLLEQQFRQAICTGLNDDLVRVELQRHIEVDSDEQLIAAVNEVTRRQAETQAKRTVKVKMAAAESKTSDAVLEQLKNLRVEINELRQVVNTREVGLHAATEERQAVAGSGNRPQQPRKRQMKCQKCVRDGSSRCIHCYECGSDEHYRNFCPQRKQNGTERTSGNDNRSRQEGGQ